MRRLTLAVVAAVTATGCIINQPAIPEPPPLPDAGLPSGWGRDGGGGGNGDGGGGVIIVGPGDGGGGIGGPGDGGGWGTGDGGGGGLPDAGRDAGTPDAGTVAWPGSGKNGDPGAAVLWVVRVDRGLANLAHEYAQLVADGNAQLEAAGFSVKATGVAVLYDEQRLLWGVEGSAVGVSTLEGVLKSAAESTEGEPTRCSVRALSQLGAQLATGRTPSGLTPFAQRRSALWVGVLDHGPRPMAYADSASIECETAGLLAGDFFGQANTSATQWLNRWAGFVWNVPVPQTRFFLAYTSESEDYTAMRARCSAIAAFPRAALDEIQPSAQRFWGPLKVGLEAWSAGLAAGQDLCDAAGGGGKDAIRAQADVWVGQLKAVKP